MFGDAHQNIQLVLFRQRAARAGSRVGRPFARAAVQLQLHALTLHDEQEMNAGLANLSRKDSRSNSASSGRCLTSSSTRRRWEQSPGRYSLMASAIASKRGNSPAMLVQRNDSTCHPRSCRPSATLIAANVLPVPALSPRTNDRGSANPSASIFSHDVKWLRILSASRLWMSTGLPLIVMVAGLKRCGIRSSSKAVNRSARLGSNQSDQLFPQYSCAASARVGAKPCAQHHTTRTPSQSAAPAATRTALSSASDGPSASAATADFTPMLRWFISDRRNEPSRCCMAPLAINPLGARSFDETLERTSSATGRAAEPSEIRGAEKTPEIRYPIEELISTSTDAHRSAAAAMPVSTPAVNDRSHASCTSLSKVGGSSSRRTPARDVRVSRRTKPQSRSVSVSTTGTSSRAAGLPGTRLGPATSMPVVGARSRQANARSFSHRPGSSESHSPTNPPSSFLLCSSTSRLRADPLSSTIHAGTPSRSATTSLSKPPTSTSTASAMRTRFSNRLPYSSRSLLLVLLANESTIRTRAWTSSAAVKAISRIPVLVQHRRATVRPAPPVAGC